jgi:phospholipase D1/2
MPAVSPVPVWRRVAIVAAVVLGVCSVLALLVTAWWLHGHFPSWRGAVTQFLHAAQHWRDMPFAPLVALACFVIGGLVAFPISWMTAATIVVFGPYQGGAYAMLGGLFDAWLVYELGRLLPAETFDRWFGERGRKLRERVVGHGLIALIVVRLVPIAPYSVVSFIAGAARVGRFDYLVGSAVGMLHDVILYGFFADRARAALLDPHPLTLLAFAGAVLLLMAAAVVLHLWKKRMDAREGNA